MKYLIRKQIKSIDSQHTKYFIVKQIKKQSGSLPFPRKNYPEIVQASVAKCLLSTLDFIQYVTIIVKRCYSIFFSKITNTKIKSPRRKLNSSAVLF